MTESQIFKRKPNFRFKFYSILALIFILSINIYDRITHTPKNPISWDTFGYYLYLPATFIYHDLGLKDKAVIDNIIDKYHSTSTFYQASHVQNGNWIMKYSMGMAILYSPGFIVGHILAQFMDYPTDGFSKPYQWALIANSILFFFIGLLVLRKILNRFFTDQITATLLILIFFGTNYFSYSTFSAEMPHNYLFTMYALILWQTILWHENHKRKHIWALAFFIGLATLARPTEIISILIPLLWNITNKETLIKKINLIKSFKSQMWQFMVILLLIGSLQVIYWKIYSGHFIYYSYQNPGEGFEFLWPYTLKTLFSFRKGWLIYTPMMIFALWGFIHLYKENRNKFFSIFIFFIVNLYIVSSWSCWWYAQSMGQRALIQSYAVLAIPFGYFLTSLSKKSAIMKIVMSLIILFFVILNQFQVWQFSKGILSLDRMTMPYYFNTFGKMVHNKAYDSLLLVDRSNLNEKVPDNQSFEHEVLKIFDFEKDSSNTDPHYSKLYAHQGSYSLVMDSSIQFSPAFKIKYKDINCEEYAWFRISVWVYPVYPLNETSTSLIVSFQHKGDNYKYRGIDLNKPEIAEQLILNQWNKINMDYLTPEVRSKNDNLIVYVWNRGKKSIYFDDMTIEMYTPAETN
ncbi:MAG: hypothetical protein Q8O72_10225 [Bacteroidales bacterium]|nr:hypothetical protein [Bacteroidales bacterium]